MTGVQTCALPIYFRPRRPLPARSYKLRGEAGGEPGLGGGGHGPAGLAAALGAVAMGKKHKKHKAEWRSSYEGEAADALCDAGRAGVRGGGDPGDESGGPGRAGGGLGVAPLTRPSSSGRILEGSAEHLCGSSSVFPEVFSRLSRLCPGPAALVPVSGTPHGGCFRTGWG